MHLEDLMQKLTAAHMQWPNTRIHLTAMRSSHGEMRFYLRVVDEMAGEVREEIHMPSEYMELYTGQDLQIARMDGERSGMQRLHEMLHPEKKQVYPQVSDSTRIYATAPSHPSSMTTGIGTAATLKGSY